MARAWADADAEVSVRRMGRATVVVATALVMLVSAAPVGAEEGSEGAETAATEAEAPSEEQATDSTAVAETAETARPAGGTRRLRRFERAGRLGARHDGAGCGRATERRGGTGLDSRGEHAELHGASGRRASGHGPAGVDQHACRQHARRQHAGSKRCTGGAIGCELDGGRRADNDDHRNCCRRRDKRWKRQHRHRIAE